MSASALSSAQFGSGSDGLRSQTVVASALPLSEKTNTTAKAAAAWRKPEATMPLGTATFGSVFEPYAPASSLEK